MRLLHISLLLIFANGLWALDPYPIDLNHDFGYGGEVHFVYYTPTGHDDFSLGSLNRGWDSSERYELLFAFDDFWQARNSWYGGAYIFWEERSWERGNQFVEAKAFGAGYEAGGRFWLTAPRNNSALNFGLAPYGRMGLAFQDVDFENVDAGSGTVYGGVDVERLEFMLGIDVIGRVGNRLQMSAGVNAHFWLSDQVGTTRSGAQVATESFNGDSIYYRFSLGMRF